MKNKAVVILTLILFYSSLAIAKDLELFVDGKRFESVEDYKLERARKIARSVYGYDNQNEVDFFIGKIKEIYSVPGLDKISDEELVKMAVSFKGQEVDLIENTDVSRQELEEMNEMLDQIQSKSKGLLTIDPKKVKTIEIKPKE